MAREKQFSFCSRSPEDSAFPRIRSRYWDVRGGPKSTSLSAVRIPQHRNGTPLEVAIVAMESASLMNLFGPAEVFAKANARCTEPFYRVRILSIAEKERATQFQMTLKAEANIWEFGQSVDTLLIAGGLSWQPSPPNLETKRLHDWLRLSCGSSRRYGAFCTGGMLLAEAGLLDGKSATGHWSRVDEMTKRYPAVQVLSDRIYVKDGNCYTAAGGTSAIDLALALVEEDLGSEVSLEIAKQMLLFLRRDGEQPQISATLLSQTSQTSSIRNLLVWMADNLEQDLSVSRLARRVAMSPRNFARHFVREVGKTPGRHVNDLRLEAAKRNLAKDKLSLGEVAKASGFGSVEVFRRLFTKAFGTSPGRYRNRMEAHGS